MRDEACRFKSIAPEPVKSQVLVYVEPERVTGPGTLEMVLGNLMRRGGNPVSLVVFDMKLAGRAELGIGCMKSSPPLNKK